MQIPDLHPPNQPRITRRKRQRQYNSSTDPAQQTTRCGTPTSWHGLHPWSWRNNDKIEYLTSIHTHTEPGSSESTLPFETDKISNPEHHKTKKTSRKNAHSQQRSQDQNTQNCNDTESYDNPDPRARLQQHETMNAQKRTPTGTATGQTTANNTPPTTATSRHQIHRLAVHRIPQSESPTTPVEMANTSRQLRPIADPWDLLNPNTHGQSQTLTM